MGRPRQSALLPLLRSEAQARVLAAIILSPAALHLRAIADRTGVPYSIVQREVDRLEQARIVASSRFASSRAVRAREDHALFPEIRALLLKAYGPRELLGGMLQPIAGIEAAYIYGSWAARYVGDWGEPWGDLDVLLVGEPSIKQVEELEAEAEDFLGQPVQIVVVPSRDWSDGLSPFVSTVKSRPLVPVEFD